MKVDVLFHFILQEVWFGLHFTAELCWQVHRVETKRAQTPSSSTSTQLCECDRPFTQAVLKWGSRKQGDG